MLVLAVKGGCSYIEGVLVLAGRNFFVGVLVLAVLVLAVGCGTISFVWSGFGSVSFVWNGWESRSLEWNGMLCPVGLRSPHSPLPPPVGSSLALFLFPVVQARRVVVLLRIRGASFSGCIRGASFGTLTR